MAIEGSSESVLQHVVEFLGLLIIVFGYKIPNYEEWQSICCMEVTVTGDFSEGHWAKVKREKWKPMRQTCSYRCAPAPLLYSLVCFVLFVAGGNLWQLKLG